MGIEIDRDRFSDEEYQRFSRRLEQSLEALGRILERPGFGVGERTIGAELELFLIDQAGDPLPRNADILEEAGKPRQSTAGRR